MASDFGMRGQAAMRLMKGKKGAPPPEEEELGLPPEEEMPPAESMGGGAPDLAALLGGGGEPPPEGMPPEGGMPPEEMPPEEMGGEAPPAQDFETALGGVEASLEGLPAEAAEEIRVHLNACREIAAQASGGAPAPEMTQGPEADMGAGELPPAPAADKEVAG